jgi:hypothetical protein
LAEESIVVLFLEKSEGAAQGSRSWASSDSLRRSWLPRGGGAGHDGPGEGYLQAGPIRAAWQQHLAGQNQWHYPLWNVLMFQAWLEHVDGR